MGVKIYKKTTPGRRQSSVNDFAEITSRSRRPVKSLTEAKIRSGGRNNQGFTTTRFRGGGAKRLYRVIDFKRKKDDVPAAVEAIEYDPNRNVFIALLNYQDGEKAYILAPNGLKVGDVVMNGANVEPKLGCCLPLKNVPVGMSIHNIELTAGKGGQMVRTAGGQARLAAREGAWATVILPSGEMRQVRVECRATIGQLGNTEFKNIMLGKAGRTRYLGRRPHVRGTAQNPVAHPLGGGEGRSGGGRHPCSPTGVLAKGGRTRNPRRNSNKRILRRRRSVRYGQVSMPGR
ncbi:MAG: 50S ribosomal protein L2 [Planctomycetes bacterium]|nr:50S ribosomal protein L2 [Planctomycetota bacterium]